VSGPLQRTAEFLRGVREELERVSWPSREELAGSVVVVFVGVFLLACYIGILDFFLSKTVQSMLR
jgi:preprotein translocase subunit SecE